METGQKQLMGSQEFQAGAIVAYLTVQQLIKKMDPERERIELQTLGLHIDRLALKVCGGK